MANSNLAVIAEADTNVGLPSVPEALQILGRLDGEIDRVETFVDLNMIAGMAKGWQSVFGRVADVSNKAGRVWVKAERKLAEKLASEPKATGTRGNFAGAASGGSKSAPPDAHFNARKPIVAPKSDAPTLKEKGVDKKRSAMARKLADIPTAKVNEIADGLQAQGKAISPSAILGALRQEAKLNKKHEIASAEFSADGPFGTVVIDPPWDMEKIDRDVRPNQDAFDYKTMSEDELEKHWVAEIADKLETDCHLFMWTTQKFLPMALRLTESYGFRYVLTMVWHKNGGFQPIGLPQYNCEFVVYARKGSPIFIDTKDFNCCFSAPRREHSRKPDEFYDVIKRVTGGSRIDVFARGPHDGFASYGNEADKFSAAS